MVQKVSYVLPSGVNVLLSGANVLLSGVNDAPLAHDADCFGSRFVSAVNYAIGLVVVIVQFSFFLVMMVMGDCSRISVDFCFP